MKDVLTHLVKAGRLALKTDEGLRNLGYVETPCGEIYGEIASALYAMLGEETDTYCESFTFRALSNEKLTEDDRVVLLFHAMNGKEC